MLVSAAPANPTTPTARRRAGGVDRAGLAAGVGAYLWWGAMAIYLSLLAPAAPLEIIAHRIGWSLVFCLVLLAATRTLPALVTALRTPRTRRLLAVAAVLVAANWTIYVYGVLADRVIDAALGYFINPLVTVLLAVLVLKEKLRPAQWIALGLGAAAVAVITTGVGGLPWIALALAVTFGSYGLVKNRVGRDVAALPGLAAETAILTPFALGYLIWLTATGHNTFGAHGAGHALLLSAAGVVTAVPLLLFASAARRIPLSLVGMLQYLTPVLQFLFGLFYFHEHMSAGRWVGFTLVWIALVILTVDTLHAGRRPRPQSLRSR